MKSNLIEPEHEPCPYFVECDTEASLKSNLLNTASTGSIPRYPVLRSIISCYKLLAWAFILGAIAVSLFTVYIFDLKQAIPVILLAIFCGIAGFINFMAISEAGLVLLDIEQNTRLMSKC